MKAIRVKCPRRVERLVLFRVPGSGRVQGFGTGGFGVLVALPGVGFRSSSVECKSSIHRDKAWPRSIQACRDVWSKGFRI